MSINDVIKQEEERLQEEIDELENNIIEWIEGIVKDVEDDRQAFPDSVNCGFGKDLALTILMTFKDFEFEQIETLQELSSKLLKLYEMKQEDKIFKRNIA